MKDIINQILGQQGGQAVQMIGALLVVVVLIVLFAWIMRRLSGNKAPTPRRGERQTQRLAVVDAAHVDGQRRLVLVRRDDVEHLVMIGGPNDVLIEPRIMRGQPMGGQRQPSQMAQPIAQAAPPPMSQPMPAAMQPPPQPTPMRVNTSPAPVAAEVASAPPQPVPMPPPFIEPVTSPASSARANPIAADLRAAMSDPRRDDYQNTAPTRMAPSRPQAPPPAPDYATGGDTMAIAPGARSGFRPDPSPQPYPPASPQPYPAVAQPRPSSRPSPSQPTLEDMVAAGLEEAISRPDPTPPRAPAPPRAGASSLSFGQRADTSGDPRRDAPSRDRDSGRSTAKDPMAAEIEKAIYGLTAAPAGRTEPPHRPAPPTFNAPRREPEISREPPKREPAPARDAFYRAPPPPEPARDATRPIQNRTAPPAAGLRPTLVANQDTPGPEPVVAVMPSPETVRSDAGRSDGRRTSSEIEDEMARLLSELTGTSGR